LAIAGCTAVSFSDSTDQGRFFGHDGFRFRRRSIYTNFCISAPCGTWASRHSAYTALASHLLRSVWVIVASLESFGRSAFDRRPTAPADPINEPGFAMQTSWGKLQSAARPTLLLAEELSSEST